jgi:putative copper resistance protein D
MPDVLSVVLRALSFVVLFQAAGVAIFIAIFGRRLESSLGAVRRLGQVAALAGVVLVAGHYVLEAARMTGDLSGMFDSSMQGMVWNSSSRAALIFRGVGLLLIALGLRAASGRSATVAVVGAVLAILAFTCTGHTSVNAHRWGLAGLLIVHLLVVAFWFGALWPLYLTSLREPPRVSAQVIDAFSAVAIWLVPGILLAGLALAIVLLPNLTALRQPYGELLLAKLAVFAVLMGLAALNKLRFGPAIARGDPLAAVGFRRSVAAEYVLIFGVLTITAVMTTFFSPE